MMTNTQKFQEPTEQEIAEYAYYLWESEGRMSGRDLDYWLQAKAQLTKTKQREAELSTSDSGANEQISARKEQPSPKRSQKPARRRQSTREPVLA